MPFSAASTAVSDMIGQMELPDTRSMKAERPRTLMERALAWIEENYYGWTYIVVKARADARDRGRVRVKKYIEDLRDDTHLSRVAGSPVRLPNAYSAPFGRILAEWYPELAESVPLGHSKVDGLSIPPCPDWARL